MTDSQKHDVTAAPAEAGTRLDRLLAQHLPDLSRSRVKALVEAGHVSAGGATISDPSYRVKPGQTFAIIVPEARPAKPQGQAIALDVVYEDGDLIVINKPAGIVMHPSPGNPDMTIVNALIAHCGDSLSGIGGELRPGIVHRIDKDTSGLLVVARTLSAHAALVEALAARAITREYEAVICGVLTAGGTVHQPIGRDERDRTRMRVKSAARVAVTHYRVIERFRAHTHVLLKLETGRTHQIRVHMQHIRHPLVGDPVYGGRLGIPAGASTSLRAVLQGFRRQALHARRLALTHPLSGAAMEWLAPTPADMQQLLTVLRDDVAQLRHD